MLKRILKSVIKRRIAKFLLVLVSLEIIAPLRALALTSGPSQPEMQSFEPVGTTDLVDPFSGNFNYNIPLLDVEGYPVNIAYHSGINMDQEASWVGLGWNINPGNVSHNVRGVPDDFNGDLLEKTTTINPEVSKKIQTNVGAEIYGIRIPINLSFGMNFSNYSGISSNFGISATLSHTSGSISGGINLGMGVSTDQGADFDYSVSLSRTSKAVKNVQNTVTGSFGQQFNSRQGLMASTFGVSSSGSKQDLYPPKNEKDKNNDQMFSSGTDYNASVTPIALTNYVPVITNAVFTLNTFFALKLGGELWGGYPHAGVNVGLDVTSFQKDGNRNAYGYLYLQNAKNDDIVDFTRDRDGRFNKKMKYLPPGNMTYDVYSTSGQGTAGSFRPFRTDVGSVYDPYTNSEGSSHSVRLELGVGGVAEFGADFTTGVTHSSSGPWQEYRTAYRDRKVNKVYEPYYFKQSGELTLSQMNNTDYNAAIGGKGLIKGKTNFDAVKASSSTLIEDDIANDYLDHRNPRANLIYYHTAAEASNPNVSLMPNILTYPTPGSMTSQPISRTAGYRKPHHISEIVQLLPDGRRYNYGIPAMNIEQVEYVASVNATSLYSAKIDGIIDGIDPTAPAPPLDDNIGQKFHMKSKTPAHAHSYLLTSVLSSDYSDLTGDGITDDDLGEFTKFNYTLMDDNYKWRTPYQKERGKLDIGVRSDCHDDKATVVAGKKEIWMLHSIESRNYIAEFYISTRADGAGSDDDDLLGAGGNNYSYKLDKIVLYNKKDRQENGANAYPIKTVTFSYDYSLCKGIPNHHVTGGGESVGKLTLKAISIKNGTSDIGLLSPYRFDYGKTDYADPYAQVVNPGYNEIDKDVWGEYKDNDENLLEMSNYEFPYVNQDNDELDKDAFAWNLTRITVPSGGHIDVKYERDDYAYVQDKRAMEMFKVEGVGYSNEFDPDNRGKFLYQGNTSPALYLFFKRQKDDELYPDDIARSYLEGIKTIMYNFEIVIDGSSAGTPSCGIPLVDNVKGYADIKESGIASDDEYAYIQINPKFATKNGTLSLSTDGGALVLNPISVSGIHYAQYYNNKALNPASEILEPNPASILEALGKSLAEYGNYVRNPMVAHLRKNLAKEFHIGRSYIRLQSQGKKKGGDHRVREVTSSDAWDDMADGLNVTKAIYGSRYDYTTKAENGATISSGVASYEPLYGGDENPCRNRVHTDMIGEKKNFPMVDPVELVVEEPLGESLFPSAVVGYSKVTISSIHKDVGEASQIIQQQEYYTAKDFPVNVQSSDIEKWTDMPKHPKIMSLLPIKKEEFRCAQSYVITLNDMHGKQKASRTFVDKGAGVLQEVSHTYYNYFADMDPVSKKMGLKNDQIPCVIPATGQIDIANKELGVEVDFTFDNREKIETSKSWGLNINTNTILFGVIPIPIPVPLPQIPKGQKKIFSSVVATKVIQKYGILKSVETFDKGSTVVLENALFDPYTGQAILTKINTQHNDSEYNLKIPAYWAYNALGSAYENILYEEDIASYDNTVKAEIINDSCFIYTDHPERFNVGDELTFTVANSCQTVQDGEPEQYKIWIADKNEVTPVLPKAFTCECENPASPAYPIYFTHEVKNCSNGHGQSLIDYSNLSNGAYATACKYYDGTSFTDKVCNLPYSQLLPINSLHPSVYNSFNMDQVLNPGNANPDLTGLEPLRNFLDATNGDRYPLEYMKSDWCGHNADFYETYSPGNNYVFTYSDLGFSTAPSASALSQPGYGGAHIPSDQTPATAYAGSAPYHSATLGGGSPHDGETPHSKANPFTFEGRIVDETSFSTLYGTKPKLYSTLKTLNVDVDLYIDVYLNIVHDGTQVGHIHIQNPDIAHALTSNNFFHKKLSFVFPYDENNPPASYTSLDQPTKVTYHTYNGPFYALYRYPNYPIWANSVDIAQNNSYTVPSYFSACTFSPNICSYNFDVEYKYTSSAEVKSRASQEYVTNAKKVLVGVPLKRGALSSTGSNKPWPKFDRINEGTIKVIRSGKRNRLTESGMEMTALEYPISGGQLNTTFDKVLSIGATEYKDGFYQPEAINDPASIYFNAFVTGGRGNFLPYRVLQYHANRGYGNDLDKNKGTINAVPFFWSFTTGTDDLDLYSTLKPGNAANWFAKSTVVKYDCWGKDLEVKDASGAIHSNLFAYNNRLPVAVVSNSACDNAMYENFEDYDENYYSQYFINYPNNSPYNFELQYFQNSIRQNIIGGLGTDFELVTTKHTGTKGLEVSNDKSIMVKFSEGTLLSSTGRPTLFPFYMRPQKYLFSYWQKQNTVNGAVATNGSVSVIINGVTYYAKAKTQAIDGWVLYEGSIDATSVPSNITIAAVTFTSGYILDDLRIMPHVSNMKAYVYNPVNKRLMAVLDENHLATIFDYTPEGKLARIKKETERGIITLKESRESLYKIINPGPDDDGEFPFASNDDIFNAILGIGDFDENGFPANVPDLYAPNPPNQNQ